MRFRRASILISAVMVAAMSIQTVHAIPAFARREGLPCQACHFRMPELNPAGRAYAQRGFRISLETPRKAGEKASANTPAEQKHPLGTPMELVLSNMADIMGSHSIVSTFQKESVFHAGEISLLLGGALSGQWSAFAEPTFDIDEGGSDVEQAYAQFVKDFGPIIGSIRFGQTMPFAIMLNQGEHNLVASRPAVLQNRRVDISNPWSPISLIRGVEVGASDGKVWNAYLGVGQPHAEEIPQLGDAFIVTTDSTHTDWYGSVERILDSRGDSITLYGYFGRHSLDSEFEPNPRFHRVGIFGNIYRGKTKATLGYLAGTEKDPETGLSLDNSGWFLLGEHLLSDRWSIYGRFDHTRDEIFSDSFGEFTVSLNSPTVGASYWMSTETRLTFEGLFFKAINGPWQRMYGASLQWIY